MRADSRNLGVLPNQAPTSLPEKVRDRKSEEALLNLARILARDAARSLDKPEQSRSTGEVYIPAVQTVAWAILTLTITVTVVKQILTLFR